MNKNSRAVLLFLFLSLLPVIPIFTSIKDLRGSVILNEVIDWKEGQVKTWTLPALATTDYEFRLESDESKWEPVIKARWKLSAQDQILAQSADAGLEWNLMRPFLNYKPIQTLDSTKLELEFLNSNGERYPVRLTVSRNRALILEKHSRLFIILLAFSLGFIVLLWKPLFTLNEPPRPLDP